MVLSIIAIIHCSVFIADVIQLANEDFHHSREMGYIIMTVLGFYEVCPCPTFIHRHAKHKDLNWLKYRYEVTCRGGYLF